MAQTLKTWLQQARQALLSAEIEAADQEARLLLCFALDVKAAYLFAWPEQQLNPEQTVKLQQLLHQRLQGQPLAWILGEWEFWGLPLKVTPATLIPRADSETLVEQALEVCTQPRARVLDLGTGTGALALALKKERPDWHLDAVDVQPAAVQLARENARRLGLDVRFWVSDWWQGVPQQHYDLVISNPPYIHPQDPHLKQGDLRFEPRSALVGGQDGLEAYRQLLKPLGRFLRPGGWFLVEHGYDQAEALAALCQQAGLEALACQQDYAGQPRVTLGRYPKG